MYPKTLKHIMNQSQSISKWYHPMNPSKSSKSIPKQSIQNRQIHSFHSKSIKIVKHPLANPLNTYKNKLHWTQIYSSSESNPLANPLANSFIPLNFLQLRSASQCFAGAVFRHGLEARLEPRLGLAAGGIGEGPGGPGTCGFDPHGWHIDRWLKSVHMHI